MKPSTVRRLSVAAVLAVFASGAPALASASSGQSAKSLIGLIEAIPGWAQGKVATALEPATAPVQFSLLLKGRHVDELRRFDAAVSNPASSSYRHFLSRAAYRRRFGPTTAETAAAEDWLRKAGFTVDSTTPEGTLVTAHATSALVGRVFDTSFGLYKVAGQLLRSPLSEPTMPAALRPLVSTVVGLAQTPAVSDAAPSPAYVNARPCSHYYGQKIAMKLPAYHGKHQPYAPCGYTMGQLRSAYGVNQVHSTGSGATVGIVDTFASPTIESDVDTWSAHMGLPKLAPGQLTQQTPPGESGLPQLNVPVLGPVLDPQGWAGEETLDVEAVHGMAPGANIVYYSALLDPPLVNVGPVVVGIDPLLLTLAQAVEGGKVDIVSNSWGENGDTPPVGDDELLTTITNEAAATGVTIDFSSGDAGDQLATSGQRVADWPTVSPGVTVVGGTTLEVNKHGQRVTEAYWGNQTIPYTKGAWDYKMKTYTGGGGGGVSSTYAEPSWQQGIVPADEATYGGLKTPGRVEPDVSMDADSTTGMLMGQTVTFANGSVGYLQYRIGGTSVSCPLFSGLLALAVAEGHHRLGLVTPALYAKSRTAAGRERLFNNPIAIARRNGFSDLANVRPDYTATDNPKSSVIYHLRLGGNVSTLQALPGYDDSTGLGTPKAPALVSALS